jgi:exonuclease VII small subunit
MNREEMLRRLDAGEDPLEVSIAKWQKIVENNGKRPDGTNDAATCALCETYQESDCNGCPVTKKTGEGCYMNTPYKKWIFANDNNKLQAAKEELAFLISLRKSAQPEQVKPQ